MKENEYIGNKGLNGGVMVIVDDVQMNIENSVCNENIGWRGGAI